MNRQIVGWTIAIVLCFSAPLVFAQQRERESQRKPGNESQGRSSEARTTEPSVRSPEASSAPGGEWSARTHSGKQSGPQSASQPTGTHGAAVASTVNKNQTPQASGAQGAAAGAAAANRNQPPYTGAQGAAAGAAAANRNQPQYSGAEGAAVGAAAVNRNQSQNAAAQEAAVGAAVVNSNQSQNAAAAGAAMANSNQPQNAGPQNASAAQTATNPNLPMASSAAAGYEAVRNSFNASNVYRPQWWRDHPETWVPAGWIPGAAWHSTPWGAIAEFCGYGNAAPISYNYGVNVTAQNGSVLVDGKNVGSTSDFSLQAAKIAQAGAAADASKTDQWQPLGVYAMVRDERQHPQLIVQLAISQKGILRGNYVDELTESTLPIRGAVDNATKRAAWLVGDNKQTVMEAGLSDLTDPETPALIHKNGKTDHWILVHLDQPKSPVQ